MESDNHRRVRALILRPRLHTTQTTQVRPAATGSRRASPTPSRASAGARVVLFALALRRAAAVFAAVAKREVAASSLLDARGSRSWSLGLGVARTEWRARERASMGGGHPHSPSHGLFANAPHTHSQHLSHELRIAFRCWRSTVVCRIPRCARVRRRRRARTARRASARAQQPAANARSSPAHGAVCCALLHAAPRRARCRDC